MTLLRCRSSGHLLWRGSAKGCFCQESDRRVSGVNEMIWQVPYVHLYHITSEPTVLRYSMEIPKKTTFEGPAFSKNYTSFACNFPENGLHHILGEFCESFRIAILRCNRSCTRVLWKSCFEKFHPYHKKAHIYRNLFLGKFQACSLQLY